MNEKWMKEITVKVIPKKYQDLVELIGIEGLLNIAKDYGGTMLYVPKYDSLTKEIRNEKIRQEFNGNYKELTKKYNLCESQIRNIINAETIDGQISMFGDVSNSSFK